MAKQIYISDDDVENLLQEIRMQVLGKKSFGSIDIKKNFVSDKRDAVVYFTADAWNKLTALVREFDTEVQWHGCVNRLDENSFEIYDILVPPHVVTAASVTTDFDGYKEWRDNLDDEIFDFLHFHGHSHVNMACTPSGTDEKYRRDLVTQLPIPRKDDEDSFYIFLIFNKRGEWSGEIYDLKYNTLYETRDIDIEVYSDEDGLLSEFVKEAKKVAVREAPTPATTFVGYKGYAGYPDYDTDKKSKDKGSKDGGGQSYIFGKGASYWNENDDENGGLTSPYYLRGY